MEILLFISVHSWFVSFRFFLIESIISFKSFDAELFPNWDILKEELYESIFNLDENLKFVAISWYEFSLSVDWLVIFENLKTSSPCEISLLVFDFLFLYLKLFKEFENPLLAVE